MRVSQRISSSRTRSVSISRWFSLTLASSISELESWDNSLMSSSTEPRVDRYSPGVRSFNRLTSSCELIFVSGFFNSCDTLAMKVFWIPKAYSMRSSNLLKVMVRRPISSCWLGTSSRVLRFWGKMPSTSFITREMGSSALWEKIKPAKATMAVTNRNITASIVRRLSRLACPYKSCAPSTTTVFPKAYLL